MDMRGATHIPLAASTYPVVSNLVPPAPPPTYWILEIPTLSTQVLEGIVSVALPLIAATISALLPDLERPGGTLRGQLPWLAYLMDRLLGQMGLFHSLPFNLLVATLTLLLGWAMGQTTLAIAFTIGLASHLVADLCTLELPSLKPFSRRCFSLLPAEKMVASSLLTVGLLLFPYLQGS
jgi:membrane-bound metal-dependent hydrolase YbcI (DUF457 family)